MTLAGGIQSQLTAGGASRWRSEAGSAPAAPGFDVAASSCTPASLLSERQPVTDNPVSHQEGEGVVTPAHLWPPAEGLRRLTGGV